MWDGPAYFEWCYTGLVVLSATSQASWKGEQLVSEKSLLKILKHLFQMLVSTSQWP